MSEKLDGVRAYWNGKDALVSRGGNEFVAPPWFTSALPQGIPLDGELYCGRGQFQETISIVRSFVPDEERWKTIRYCVFDAPHETYEFEQRLTLIHRHKNNIVEPVKHVVCTGQNHLNEELTRVIALKGEGLMLRQPKSKYEPKRSNTLLKVKKAHDAEAKVIGYTAGKGKNAGKVGALKVQMANGTEFKLGSGLSDKDRDHPPAVGSIVTYTFNELTKGGVPRFPRFLRERKDMKKPRDLII